jgi:molybdate transport system regulatory protein
MNAKTPGKRSSKPSRLGVARQAPSMRFRMRVMSGETISVGPGKIALLEAIRQTRSITAAAKSMRMSYRRAWMLVDELNAALKKPAVHSAKGGDHGGGSELTAEGESLVGIYRRIEERAARTCATEILALLRMVR